MVPAGFVVTQPSGGGVARHPHLAMIAIDCEMCYTAEGLELTRASAVSADGSVMYDKLVKPPRPITNYNTAHSGRATYNSPHFSESLHKLFTQFHANKSMHTFGGMSWVVSARLP